MLILTLSSYNDNDGNIEEFVGVFENIEAINKHIEEEWGEGDYMPYQPCEDVRRSPREKPGVRKILMSNGHIDNGWGGRYFSVWQQA